MSLPPEYVRRLAAVLTAETEEFTVLTKIAGLDPAKSFRGADLRGVDLSRADLKGYDFSGANLAGANLSKARTVGMMWDQETVWPKGWRPKPPADFDLGLVHSLLAHGENVKEEWRPFVSALDFSEDFQNRFSGSINETIEQIYPPSAVLEKVSGAVLPGSLVLTVAIKSQLPPAIKHGLELLPNYPNLAELAIRHRIMDDLAPIGAISTLQTLDISGCDVADLEPMSRLRNLRILKLNFASVANLSPLGNLNNLEELYLNDIDISDIRPLVTLPKLRVLELEGTQFGERQRRRLEKGQQIVVTRRPARITVEERPLRIRRTRER